MRGDSKTRRHRVQYVDRPQWELRRLSSHIVLILEEGQFGPLLAQVAPEFTAGALRMRCGVGPQSESNFAVVQRIPLPFRRRQ